MRLRRRRHRTVGTRRRGGGGRLRRRRYCGPDTSGSAFHLAAWEPGSP